MQIIYKIVPASLWSEAIESGTFKGSPVDLADGAKQAGDPLPRSGDDGDQSGEAAPKLLEARARTVETMRLVNAMCRFVELAEEP